jgi:hypothetical protein
MTWQDPDPVTGGAFPPLDFETNTNNPFWVESGFFASACNDEIWGFSRKRDFLSPSGSSFNNVSLGNHNRLLQWVLDAGVLYQTAPLGFEAPAHQQFVVERFTRQAERIIRGGSAGLPALTSAAMRAFVGSSEQYHDDSYAPPPNLGITSNAALPTPIRQLQEIVDNSSNSASPVTVAQKELQFFNDLWTSLFGNQSHGPLWDQHQVVGNPTPLTLSLRDLWVKGNVQGHENQFFWYDNPTNLSNPGIRWFDLPASFPLIDFVWQETEAGRGTTAGFLLQNGVLSTNGPDFGSLVAELVNWDPVTDSGSAYRGDPTSTGACLLGMMRAGYNARTNGIYDFGRHWVRLSRGEVEYSGSGWAPLTASGQLPGGGTLVRQNRPWAALAGLAFPGGQLETLMRPAGGGVSAEYAALYDPSTNQPRAVLNPVQTNALVKFFLRLGNHYVEPQNPGDNPSTKLARFQLLGSSDAAFLADRSDLYPLTDGLMRLTVARSLLDAGQYLQSTTSGIPPLSQCLRARAYGHTGRSSSQSWVWPASPETDHDCVGGGGLRAVAWMEDETDPGRVLNRGFQPKFLGFGGSISPLLALFPNDRSGVDSYYWCTPGEREMTSEATRFDVHMDAFATNMLLSTHYDDFLNPSNIAWTWVHEY